MSSEYPFLLESWLLNDGQATRPDHSDTIQPNHWYHCQREVSGIDQWLAKSGVSQPVIEALLAEDTRPRFELLPEGFMLNLRGVNLNEGAQPEDMVSMRILWFNNSLVTLRGRAFRAIKTVVNKLEQRRGPVTLPTLLVAIAEEISIRIEDTLDDVEQKLELLEDDNSEEARDILTVLHRRLLRINRFVRPQVGALERFCGEAPDLWQHRDAQRLVNVKDTTQRVLETIDMLLQQISVIRDEIHQVSAERLNNNTYWLSVIAGVFLPLGFLTGLLGMNVGGMPGLEQDWAFWIACGLMTVIAVVEFLLLRRLKFW